MSFIFLSNHALSRLRERHGKLFHTCKTDEQFKAEAMRVFGAAEFSNRHLNDTAFMIHMQEKYGYHSDYKFKVHKNLLFVIVGRCCTTVLDTDTQPTTRQHTGKAQRTTPRLSMPRQLPAKTSSC